ncbi:MAG: hypothetical protein QOJ42_1731, partial [Acidobacteriaceae bacterium]|nr:hypothetical protein [Acidobacteriaceae bacterium]
MAQAQAVFLAEDLVNCSKGSSITAMETLR